jgi:hypothetical protein
MKTPLRLEPRISIPETPPPLNAAAVFLAPLRHT